MPAKDEPKDKPKYGTVGESAREAAHAPAHGAVLPKDEAKPAPRLADPHHDEPAAPSAPLRSEPPRCPHCDGVLVAHGGANPYKIGAQHCSSCGCCLINGELRPGHLPCSA